jgi:hypothetical protein
MAFYHSWNKKSSIRFFLLLERQTTSDGIKIRVTNKRDEVHIISQFLGQI